jgi:hypothetical protein
LFLSYSRKDQFFAELAEIKLKESNIELWCDQGQLKGGDDWRAGIEAGISESLAVMAVMSERSVLSPYVTYEWAYALGREKVIIPIKLDNCSLHPRLAAIQHIDFSAVRPWSAIAERVRSIETDKEPMPPPGPAPASDDLSLDDAKLAKDILDHLNSGGLQVISFRRISELFGPELSDNQLREMVLRNRSIFRLASIKGAGPGLAKVVP